MLLGRSAILIKTSVPCKKVEEGGEKGVTKSVTIQLATKLRCIIDILH